MHCHLFKWYDYIPKRIKKVHFCGLQKGYYCPEGSETAVPCPRGMFAPSFWARDINGCISCPPHHYAPTEGLASCLPCGSRAQQPLPGQDKCVCLSEGQVFQVSFFFWFLFIYANRSAVSSDAICSLQLKQLLMFQRWLGYIFCLSVVHLLLNLAIIRFSHRKASHNKQIKITRACTKGWGFPNICFFYAGQRWTVSLCFGLSRYKQKRCLRAEDIRDLQRRPSTGSVRQVPGSQAVETPLFSSGRCRKPLCKVKQCYHPQNSVCFVMLA